MHDRAGLEFGNELLSAHPPHITHPCSQSGGRGSSLGGGDRGRAALAASGAEERKRAREVADTLVRTHVSAASAETEGDTADTGDEGALMWLVNRPSSWALSSIADEGVRYSASRRSQRRLKLDLQPPAACAPLLPPSDIDGRQDFSRLVRQGSQGLRARQRVTLCARTSTALSCSSDEPSEPSEVAAGLCVLPAGRESLRSLGNVLESSTTRPSNAFF